MLALANGGQHYRKRDRGLCWVDGATSIRMDLSQRLILIKHNLDRTPASCPSRSATDVCQYKCFLQGSAVSSFKHTSTYRPAAQVNPDRRLSEILSPSNRDQWQSSITDDASVSLHSRLKYLVHLQRLRSANYWHIMC